LIDPSADDHELMHLLAGDSTEALEELMRRWQPAVQRLVMRSVRDAGAAEEIAQETFWRLWRARTQYQFTGKFLTWLFRIAVRLALDHHRSRARRPALVEDEGIEMVAGSPTQRPDQGIYEEELATADL
jgi:RNA polymerase sigma-70 factor (ECF subfamily)